MNLGGIWRDLVKFGEICKFFLNFVILLHCSSFLNFLTFLLIFETWAVGLSLHGNPRTLRVCQRSFSFPLRGWSLLNVVLLVTTYLDLLIVPSFFKRAVWCYVCIESDSSDMYVPSFAWICSARCL